MSETYVGSCKHCGCFVAGRHIDDGNEREDAKSVAEWVRRGLIVNRVPSEKVREMSWDHAASCPESKPTQKELL